MVEIQKKEFVTNGAIPLQVKRTSRCAAEKWIALSFLHRLAAAESWTNHRLRSGSTNVSHQTCVIRLRVELAGDDGEDGDMFVVFYTKMTTIAAIRLTPYNFTPNHLTFTVFAITEDVAVKTHSRVKASTSPTSGRPE
ncbi:BnaA06g16450D [Brassica napus]|uniref:BnaA06g16450D protein n=1 Tax=Brassica napus TaxID=3708 RepID=A0A078F423_BRANA|nr:BnaA06g16450D [Brassica napus]